MGLGDFSRIVMDSMGDVPDQLQSAADGFKGLFGGFNDLVRKT